MQNNFKLFILIFSFSTLFFGCNENSEQKKRPRSLYIWTSQTNITETDNKFFLENDIKNLYIRFFDVEPNNLHGEIPVSELNFSGKIDENINIVPVVFIKNEVMKNKDSTKVAQLADKLHFKISEIFEKKFENRQFSEFQIDCDWSETTRESYFLLLKLLKQKFEDKKLSVTIRLHQIKYQEKTGVPPADKGVLMYYNMGDFLNPNEPNSILNNEIGEQYLNKNSSYPLQLSLALPVYSWGIWFNYNNFENIIGSINNSNADNLEFLSLQTHNEFNKKYVVLQDTVFADKYLRWGDIIKLEKIELGELINAKKICNPLITKQTEFILFSYSSEPNQLFEKENLEMIFE